MMVAHVPRSPPTLAQSLSAELRTTRIMSRVYDLDGTLSDATARQLVVSLERLGIIVRMASPPTEAERELERLRQEQDDYLDEALKETFPASDPIAPGHPHPRAPA